MASTKQMHTFVERLKENDRVLFVGDTRQHEAVEAGRPYAQLQDAGLRTAHLDEIIRQKDPALKEVVEQLARGEVRQAIASLNLQGRVHEISDRQERIAEIAREYVRQPQSTLLSLPTTKVAARSTAASIVQCRMQGRSKMRSIECMFSMQGRTSLEPTGSTRRTMKQAMSSATRKGRSRWASRPESMRVSVPRIEKRNTITVKRRNGDELSYDPRRLQE